MKTKRQIKRILAALWMNGTAGRDILSGIFDYARAGHPWRIDLLQLPCDASEELLERVRTHGLDGVITSETAQPVIQRILDLSNAPTVSVRPGSANRQSSHRESSVGCNDYQIGEMAARYFLRLGRFRAYAFLGVARNTAWSDERERGFRDELSKNGESCFSLKLFDSAFYLDRQQVTDFLRPLPRPVAIATAYDGYGVQLLDICRESSIAVPGEVSVIGVDNDELLCDFSEPPLTSICPDHHRVGLLAAQELDALMRSPNRKPRHLECPIKTIVERSSVQAPAPSATLLRRMLAYIRKHAAEGISVADVARYVGVSRRLADLRFREAENQSILEYITARRMEIAEKLLRDSALKISVIATRSGYRQLKSFLSAFKRTHAATPTKWRSRHSKS